MGQECFLAFLFIRTGSGLFYFIRCAGDRLPAVPAEVSLQNNLRCSKANPLPRRDFTVPIRLPDSYKIAPHWQPKRENVTVLRETFNQDGRHIRP
jgi:hypothetical protein